MEALTVQENKTLKAYERTIERGLKFFFEAGEALAAIRESKLYKDTHDTFEAYCRERWGWSKTHANRLIEASLLVEDLTPIGVIPKTESQVRPLARIAKEQRAEVWQQAIDTAPKNDAGEPKITAKHVEETVKQWTEPEPEPELETEVSYDYLENPLTDQQAAVFEYETVIDETIGLIKAAQRSAKELADSPAGKFLNLKLFRAATKDAIGYLEATRPYCLCPYCSGRKCTACAHVGIVPKEVHEQAQ